MDFGSIYAKLKGIKHDCTNLLFKDTKSYLTMIVVDKTSKVLIVYCRAWYERSNHAKWFFVFLRMIPIRWTFFKRIIGHIVHWEMFQKPNLSKVMNKMQVDWKVLYPSFLWKGTWSFIWKKLNPNYPRMLWAKFWLKLTERWQNMKSLRRQRRRTTDT